MTTRSPRSCANPSCDQPVIRAHRRGRPPLYCSPTCRNRHRAKPRPPADPNQLTVHVGHDHPGPGRPAGPVWHVTLTRGLHTVTIATGLGRPSADHLAHQLHRLIRPSGAAND